MPKKRTKITFKVEIEPMEIEVPNQESGKVFIRKLNMGLRSSLKKALGLPKEVKLTDSFKGVVSGTVEGSDDAASFVLAEFGTDSEEEDFENSEEEVFEEDFDPGNSQEEGLSEPFMIMAGPEGAGFEAGETPARELGQGSGRVRKSRSRKE